MQANGAVLTAVLVNRRKPLQPIELTEFFWLRLYFPPNFRINSPRVARRVAMAPIGEAVPSTDR